MRRRLRRVDHPISGENMPCEGRLFLTNAQGRGILKLPLISGKRDCAGVAQGIEQWFPKPLAAGSIPVTGVYE